MKLLILSILFVLIPSDDWLADIKNNIAKVDAEAKMIKEKTIVNGHFSGTMTKSKLKNNRLITFIVNDTTSFNNELSSKVYSYRQRIYADFTQMMVPHIYKGRHTIDLPIAAIIEKNSYYKNENKGITFYREIDVYKGDNIDSLKQELKKLDFEQKQLNGDDYDNVKLFVKTITKF